MSAHQLRQRRRTLATLEQDSVLGILVRMLPPCYALTHRPDGAWHVATEDGWTGASAATPQGALFAALEAEGLLIELETHHKDTFSYLREKAEA